MPSKRAVIGHNSCFDGAFLEGLIEEIEEGEVVKEEWSEHIKAIYTRAKSEGLCPKTIKKIVKARKASREKLREEKELLHQYVFAIDPDLADVLS